MVPIGPYMYLLMNFRTALNVSCIGIQIFSVCLLPEVCSCSALCFVLLLVVCVFLL